MSSRSWFQSLRISRKLLVAFGAILSLNAVLGALALTLLGRVTATSHELATSWLPSIEYLADMRAVLNRIRLTELRHVEEQNADAMSGLEREFGAQEAEMNRLRHLYEPLISSDAERALYLEFVRQWDGYEKEHGRVLELSRLNQNAEAMALLKGQSQQIFDAASTTLQDGVNLNRKGGDAEVASAERLRLSSWILMLLGLAVTIGFGLLMAKRLGDTISERITLAVGVARRMALGEVEFELPEAQREVEDETEILLSALSGMVESQREMARVANELARGNLDVRVSIRSSKDLLGKSFETMLESLSSMVSLVRSGAAAVSTAAGQIEAAARELSRGTSEQAASATQSSTGLREVNTAVSRTAEVVSRLDQMAREGAERASSSGEAVRETLELMRVIEERTSFVERVARETHLLALNASLEAVRAGDRGKGFSIIAGQVRSLAESSRTAAKDIAEIVSRSTELANRSGVLIDALVPSIVVTATLVQNVAVATRDQATGIAQINEGMLEVAHVSERTAAAAGQLTETAGVLLSSARDLDVLAGRFRIQGEAKRAAA